MEKIYLNIAGFTILCWVKESEQKYHKNKFIKMLREDYSGFISKKIEKPDFIFKIYSTGSVIIRIDPVEKDLNENFDIRLMHLNYKRRTISFHNPPGGYDFEYAISTILNKYLIPKNNGLILHGSAVSYKNNAYIFEGRSGAGKSTTVQLLDGLCTVLADDTIYIRKINNIFYLFQTIRHEKNYNFSKNSLGYPIDKIFFIKKSDNCYIKEYKNKSSVLKKLLRQLYTYDRSIKDNYSTIAELASSIDSYYLYVKKDEKIFKDYFKYEALRI